MIDVSKKRSNSSYLIFLQLKKMLMKKKKKHPKKIRLKIQKESFYQAKAERKARAEANAQALAGAFLMVAGAAAASNSNSSTGYNAGVVAAASGAGLLAKSAQTSREAKVIREGINELGKDLNIAITPNVIQMEDRLIEVTGDASEQYREWRRVLKEVYEKQETPQIAL